MRLLPVLSLRSRITLSATVIVGAVLSAGAIGLVRLQLRSLDGSLDSGLELRAADLSASVSSGSLPVSVAVGDDEVAAVQVIGPAGSVVSASENMRGLPPMLSPETPDGSITSVDKLPFEDDPFRILAARAQGRDGAYVILVAGSRDDALESAAALATLLWFGVPVITAGAAGGIFLLVGRAMAPVEAMRRQAEGISTTNLARRVPEPRAHDEIGRLARTMNQMLDRIQQGYEREQTFAADAAHELRTPLASLGAQLESGEMCSADLLAEVRRLQRTVDDLLLLGAAESLPGPERLPLVDFEDIVREEIRRASIAGVPAIDASRVVPAAVRGDAVQLGHAVRNILENALRYGGGKVEVELSEAGGSVILAVSDDGPGIPPADRERVFERFTRLDEGRSRSRGGAGLGLAIVRRVAQQHGGTPWIEDSSMGGTRVVVSLPAPEG